MSKTEQASLNSVVICFSEERRRKMERQVELYDTTLRDGAQMKGISFSLQDKLEIVQILDELGITYIEGGWPGANDKETEFFKVVSSLNLKSAEIVAFSMTHRKGVSPEEDRNMQNLLAADVRIVTLVGKTWLLHTNDVLNVTPEENLQLIEESCSFFACRGRKVFYDAEHFFTGFKDDPDYALETLRAAVNGGAQVVILCDTNGSVLPWEVNQAIRKVKTVINVPLGIHTHNDEGLAVANTAVAVKEGALQVQGTLNGYGERCGNADLCSVIPVLQLKMGFSCLLAGNLTQLTEVSRKVAEIANLVSDPSQPFVGSNAFSHKGGMHAHATTKKEGSYQHINPILVGNQGEIVVSELAGKASILAKAKEIGIDLSVLEAEKILHKIERLEYQGFQFEVADASVELLIRRTKGEYRPLFEVLDFTVLENQRFAPKAMVKLKVRNQIIHSAAEGDGPVNALDQAVREGLLSFYPELERVHLVDYKVRILNEKAGTGAKVRVLIVFSANGNTWTTVGSSTDIIEASWQALRDGLEFALLKHVS